MTDAMSSYERLRPLIVWLGLTELGWLGYWLLSGGNRTAMFVGTVVIWLVTMLAWLAVVIDASRRGFFLAHSERLSNLLGVALVVTFAVALFGLIPDAWQGVVSAARNTSDLQLISIHLLRLLAIGTVVKFIQGALPLHFVILGSLPDVWFGISAVVVVALAARGTLEPSFLVAWHGIGFAVFLGAGVSMFFSVPSPLRLYYNQPDASIVFRFPMVVAPTFTVPLFMIAHLFALVKMLG